MTTITVPAVYRGGVIQPRTKLDLPDDTPVQVQIALVSAQDVLASSLFGAFPELTALTGEDFAWAKRLWEHSTENQSRLLDEQA